MTQLTSDRQRFAESLSTVIGVKGYAQQPSATRTGDAWPTLGAIERSEGWAFEINWRVLVVLPGGDLAIAEWIDAHLDQLVDALQPLAHVERMEVVSLPTATGGSLPALEISMKGD